MRAAANGHKEVIELLLNHGADPSAVNWVRGDDDDDDDDDVDDHSLI
jgi:ankyrin repeat protein